MTTVPIKRRDFLTISSATLVTTVMSSRGFAKKAEHIDAEWYRRSRRFAELPLSRVAYVEHGQGPAALFIHGFPLSGFQWRGALERLHTHRRCIAPDVMGMGFTQTSEGQKISPQIQADMLGMLLDKLQIDTVDLVGNDSGGMVSQLFLAKFPQRVRTLLLTNCDVDTNSPPPQFVPFIEKAKQGLFVDEVIVPQLKDKPLARTANGLGGLAFTYPEKLADETIEMYFGPMVETALKKSKVNEYAASMATNPLVAIREELRHWKGSARMVWGLKDALFPVEWAEWLNKTLQGRKVSTASRKLTSFSRRNFPI